MATTRFIKLLAVGGLMSASLSSEAVAPLKRHPIQTVEKYPFKPRDFDGTGPLKYETVVGPPDSRLYLLKIRPADCEAADAGLRQGSYVVPGDVVAVAETCGLWAHVQYIGKTKVSAGWVSANRLAGASGVASKDEGVRGEIPSDVTHYHFSLTRGRGLPVCEAYLQRLNQSPFVKPPQCGLPEFDGVPGFAHLRRHALSAEEFNRIYPTPGSAAPADAWTIDGGLDIENHGQPDQILVFTSSFDCGVNRTHLAGYSAVILSRDGSRFDQPRTQKIFEREGPPDFPRGQYYRVGEAFGLFVYRNTTYFDTFFDLDYEHSSRSINTLVVYSWQGGQRCKVCEYFLNDLNLE